MCGGDKSAFVEAGNLSRKHILLHPKKDGKIFAVPEHHGRYRIFVGMGWLSRTFKRTKDSVASPFPKRAFVCPLLSMASYHVMMASTMQCCILS